MERYETSNIPQARATSDSLRNQEDDNALGNLLRAQNEILQRFSDGNMEDGTSIGKRVKLPTIKLPTFDGKIEEWTKFSDAFTKTIHDNLALPNIQKFIYLRSCVTGAAARAIEDIELFDDNYLVAWEQLQKRFEDSGIIKRRHIQCLFEMPLVDKELATAILNLVDHVNKHIQMLKRLGAPTNSWGDLLLYMVESKLNKTTLRAWEERTSIKVAVTNENEISQDSNFDELMEFLIQRCHALKRIESSKAKVNHDVGKTSKIQGQFRSHSKINRSKGNLSDKVTSLASSVTSGACFVCNESHLLYNCAKFLSMTVEERFKEARRLKLCINCLRNDHFSRNCKHGFCHECSGRHNTLLHRPTSEKQPIVNEAAKNSTTDSSTRTTCHSSGTSRCNILMATAIVDAVNQEGFSLPIRVLLDSASEANLVTQGIYKLKVTN